MIDYADYGAKLAKPVEIAAAEKIPLHRVMDDLRTEPGRDYYAAFANTIIYLKSILVIQIQKDPDSIKLLKNLEEIEKAATILESGHSQDVNGDVLAIIFERLGTSTLDETLFTIDMLMQK